MEPFLLEMFNPPAESDDKNCFVLISYESAWFVACL